MGFDRDAQSQRGAAAGTVTPVRSTVDTAAARDAGIFAFERVAAGDQTALSRAQRERAAKRDVQHHRDVSAHHISGRHPAERRDARQRRRHVHGEVRRHRRGDRAAALGSRVEEVDTILVDESAVGGAGGTARAGAGRCR